MNFNFFLRSFRILLLPFALLYWLVVWVRNFLFDKKVMRSAEFNLPIVCVGNLAVGGTGKTPMVEYLIRNLRDKYKLATLSRGYKRKTKGYALANEQTTALEIGDEPMQFHLKFPEIPVAVGEARVEAIPQLLHDKPDTELIILDDAFQHRSVKAGLNILLTEAGNLFTRDFYLPTGDLRDLKARYKQADIIVVAKCKPLLQQQEKEKIIREIKPLSHQQVFFTAIEYGQPYHILSKQTRAIEASMEALLVCAIANPDPLKQYLTDHTKSYIYLTYNDHHIFTIDDLKDIKKKFEGITAADKCIFTTEKDAVRLLKFKDQLESLPLYVIPVQHFFLFGEGTRFNECVIDFTEQFHQNNKD
jgi:tetraacyldisaccharide 4'-kinase